MAWLHGNACILQVLGCLPDGPGALPDLQGLHTGMNRGGRIHRPLSGDGNDNARRQGSQGRIGKRNTNNKKIVQKPEITVCEKSLKPQFLSRF